MLDLSLIHRAVQPPSTAKVWPAAKDARSEQRNSTMFAISAGCAKRPIGEFARKKLRISGLSNQCLVIGVATNPGAIALIRIPWLAYSIAAAFDKPITACFAAT